MRQFLGFGGWLVRENARPVAVAGVLVMPATPVARDVDRAIRVVVPAILSEAGRSVARVQLAGASAGEQPLGDSRTRKPRAVVKVGLMIYLANEKKNNDARSYSAIRALAQQAEADGFDSIWLPDHLMYRSAGGLTQGSWECWTIVAALAEATRRVEIGTLVLNNSLRNPAILAKMATAADEVSQGRLILGIGAGWNEPEYRSFGLPFDHRVSRFEEALQIVRPMLRDGHVDFKGRYFEARDCDNLPRGPRPQGPPLMVGAEGPRMIRLAAQYGDAWNIGYMGTPDTMAGPIAKIEAACRQVGRDPATIDVIPLIGLWFPELKPEKPTIFDDPLTGSVTELAAAMRGYEELGVPHIIFQYYPYTPEALHRLTEAVRRYRGME